MGKVIEEIKGCVICYHISISNECPSFDRCTAGEDLLLSDDFEIRSFGKVPKYCTKSGGKSVKVIIEED